MLALSPILVFMIIYLAGSLMAGDFYKVPLTAAFLIASAYAVCITPRLKLKERIATMWKKYTAVSEPTPMILENMRQEAKKLTDDVKAYLESLNG